MPSAPSARFARRRAAHPKSASRRDRAIGAFLFILLALAAAQCARLGAAGFYVQLAQGEIDQWTSPARKPGKAELRGAANYFLDSLGYASTNPWSLEGLASLDLARMRGSKVPLEALAVTRGARVRLRQALLQRPTSPFLWANLALTKLYLEEVDDELLTALRHADELGPWEPAVQQAFLFVGLAVWPDLDSGLRQALTRTVERGGQRDAGKMLEIVKSYGRFDLVCAMGQYRAAGAPECAKAAVTAAPGAPAR